MRKPHVFISGEDKSTSELYRLQSPETGEVFNDAVKVASEMFEDSVACVLLHDSATTWCNLKLDTRSLAALVSLKDKLSQSSSIFEMNSKMLEEVAEEPIVLQESKLACYAVLAPLTFPEGKCLGSLCILKHTSEPLTKQQQTILKILAKDLVSQLELRKKNIQLENLTELYELIIETNQDLIFAKDKEYKIVLANSAFMALYPKDMQDKIIGFTTFEAYKEEEVSQFLQNDKITFRTGISDVIERITFPKGEVRTINTIKTRFFDNAGEPYILGVSRDVTEKEDLIAKLQKSNDDLDEFAYVASHDLKSPLNAIKRLVSFIEEDNADGFDDLTSKHFDMIKGRADRMSKLLSDLLRFSRIGRDPQEFETLNIRDVGKGCIELLDKPEGFNVKIEASKVFLPRVPFELVLTNLMSNAIKHHTSDTGQIVITCKEHNRHYHIVVEDDGPGIPEKMYGRVFQKFQTLKPRDQVEGSGMGLSMVEKSVEHYGGSITLGESELGGAKFMINWPKKEVNNL